MASPTTTNKTSWLKDKLTRRVSGQSSKSNSSFEDNSLDDFEHVLPGKYPLGSIADDWEVLTLAKQKNNDMNRTTMESNHTDGVAVQGGNKYFRKTSNNSKIVSPILGRGGIKSALKQQEKKPEMDRPASAGANAQKSTTNKKKLLTADYNNSRTPSPGMDRTNSQRSSFRRKGVITPVKESSPIDMDHYSGNTGSNFSKIRDTLRIRKGKKKSTKVAQYSVPELNFPYKYEDPFDVSTEFSDSHDSAEAGASHEFIQIDVPHHKPEYCDHCQQSSWGHNQTLKCTKCDFIVHKKCEGRIFVKCNFRIETDSVLQRDRVNETEEEPPDPSLEKDIKSSLITTVESTNNGQQPTPSSNGVHAHTNSEKALLARKIREYNRKTTPVHHIHIKSRDTTIDYQGFVRVHMSIQRPIHVSTGVTRTSWYRLMRPVKEKHGSYGLDGAGALETAFYLPIDTNRLVHINNTTTTKELVITLLKKFCITDNPKKFSLYEEYGGDCRRLFEEDRPLTVILEGSVARRNSKLVLRDNLCSTIQWDAFSLPELNNFIAILRREEDIYASRMSDCFFQWKKFIEGELSEKTNQTPPTLSKDNSIVNGDASHHPLTISKHAPLVQ